ncbi:MAG: hypothetical protein ACP5NI_05210 [Acetobacteraceae bacterium]
MTMKSRLLAAAAAAALLGAGGYALTARAAAPQVLTMYVLPGGMGFVGPDHLHHDTIAPANLVLRAGQPVTLRVVNFDDGMHTIYAPGLKLDLLIRPGVHYKKPINTATSDVQGKKDPDVDNEHTIKPTVSTVTFTPAKAGEFRWHCLVPCDGGKTKRWDMTASFDGPDQDGFMAGYFKVLPAKPTL